MAGVADPNVVDLVAESAEGRATLFMVEVRPWGTDAAQADELLAKVNTYYHFVLDGQFARDYPELVGKPVDIRLSCATDPTEDVRKVVDAAAQGLASHGIGFSVVVEPNLQF